MTMTPVVILGNPCTLNSHPIPSIQSQQLNLQSIVISILNHFIKMTPVVILEKPMHLNQPSGDCQSLEDHHILPNRVFSSARLIAIRSLRLNPNG